MRQINKLIVHCSDTANDHEVTVDDIRDWHIDDNGWSDIGYHYVITRTGNVHAGRPVEQIGAHCKGYNAGSIGVCLIGTDAFTASQFKALKNLYSMLGNIFTGITLHGHRDFTATKTCPNFDVAEIS